MKDYKTYRELSNDKDVKILLKKYVSWIRTSLQQSGIKCVSYYLLKALLVDGDLFFLKEETISEDGDRLFLYTLLLTDKISLTDGQCFEIIEKCDGIFHSLENILHIKANVDYESLYGMSIFNENRVNVDEYIRKCYELCFPAFQEIEKGIYFGE